MTIYQGRVERLRYFEETDFGTDYSGSAGSFQQIPFHEGSAKLNLGRPVVSPMHAQQRIDGYPLGVLLPKTGTTLEFVCNLETASTKATSTVAATHTWLTRLLEIALGHTQQMTGTTAAAGWNTVTGDVAVATSLRGGGAMGAVYSGNGFLECREIQSKVSSTIEVKLAFSEAPAESETLYGCSTVYCSSRATGLATSGQFIIEGWNVEDRFLLTGGHCTSLTFSFAPGQIPTCTQKWEFANWLRADGSETSADLTGSVISQSTYTDTNTLVVADSEFRVQTVGTSTLSGTLYHPSEIVIEPQVAFAPVMTPAGVQNVLGRVRIHQPPVVRGSFTLPYEDNNEWWTAKTARTAKMIAFQVGTSPTHGAMLFAIPNAQITDVQRMDNAGVNVQKVDWWGRGTDSDTTAESGQEGIAESAFRIHSF